VELTQTYNTNQLATLYDRQYQSNNVPGSVDAVPTHFSPVALSVRAMPTNEITANLRAEFDPRYHSLRTISASGSYSWANLFQFASTWSKRGFIPQLAEFNDTNLLDQAINAQTTVHTANNRVGGIYSLNYDILHKNLLQQRLSGFYNAQCCGIAFEYQTVNYGLAQQRTDHVRPPLLHVVHARRAGELLAVQRRARWGAPVNTRSCRPRFWSPGPAVSPAAICWIFSRARTPRSWRGIALEARRARRDRPCGGRQSICWIAAPSARPSPAHGRPRYTTARRPRTSARRGIAPNRRSPSTCSAPIIYATRSGARTCACSS
jgi:hypothetical protein